MTDSALAAAPAGRTPLIISEGRASASGLWIMNLLAEMAGHPDFDSLASGSTRLGDIHNEQLRHYVAEERELAAGRCGR